MRAPNKIHLSVAISLTYLEEYPYLGHNSSRPPLIRLARSKLRLSC